MDHSLNNFSASDGKGQSQEHQHNTSFRLNIDRPLYEHENLRENYQYEKIRTTVSDRLRNTFNTKKCNGHLLKKTIPSILWLKKYQWKEDFIADLICGITMAIVQIPLGLACALLGHLPPIYGVYMAFFPVFIYCFLGTSRHVSIGAFAVTALMTGKAVILYATPDTINNENDFNGTIVHSTNNGSFTEMTQTYTPVEVATAITFMVGIIQLVMCIFRLGIIASLFSETFINGFTTASALHVILSLINDVLGINLPVQKGYFKLVRILIALYNEIHNTNLIVLLISVSSMVILVVNNEFVKPWVEKRSRVPVPIETIIVIIGTAITYYFNLATKYDVAIAGEIPTGLPAPSLPGFDVLPKIILDSISIAMVCYTITMSMGMMFAQKVGYKIDSNQELFALGWSNIFGSFFSCMPVSAALGRSVIQFTTGGKTQLTSIISCVILLFVLLWIGPLFECLPRGILAAIVIVSLKGMILQMREFKKFWKLSKYDAMIWFLTFLSTMIVGIDIGLLTGLIASIASILIQSVKPKICILGQIPDTELFLDVNRYKGALELTGIKIFHYSGSLNFINEKGLKSKLCKAVGVVPEQVIKQRTKMAKQGIQPSVNLDILRYIILDMSSVTFVDPTGVMVLRSIASEFLKIDVTIYLAACSTPVFEVIKKCDMFEKNEPSFHTFATVLDAVYFCHKKDNLNSTVATVVNVDKY